MSISIQTNVNSVVAQENLRVTNDFQSKTIERLTSGYRINSSGDDAAGLAVANKFRSDIAELTQGVRNANDGLSQLQIVDSGLNNISKILDRLKTLATQSASTTFTGDRSILDNEYTSLLTEIDRQAANIGLGTGDTNASRNNTAISVYIGGGSAQANSKIAIDLSASTNLVNATGLQLVGTGVSGGVVPTEMNTIDMNLGALYLDQLSTQTWTIATTTGTSSAVVTGTTAGILGSEVVTQLNAGLSATGVSFSLNATTGHLQASSANSYAVTVSAKTGAGAQVQAAVTDTDAKNNLSKYNGDAGTLTAVTVAPQTLTFTPAGGTAVPISLIVAGSSADVVYNTIKAGLIGSGIDAIRSGTEVFFQSNTAFTVARGAADGSTGGLGNIASGASLTVVAKAASSDPTGNAMTSLTALATAVAKLGTVQGKVGTGQNKLAYSIQLAQSQLSGYAAAESRIRDADVAVEAANLTKVQVLTQASIAAMAQANSAPQQVLALLRG
ncbi:MAG: flagellin [Acidobacteria bacterium]|nr:flagellin [Acidobacteriota bacterium]